MRRLIRPIIGLLFSSLAGSLLAGTDLIVWIKTAAEKPLHLSQSTIE